MTHTHSRPIVVQAFAAPFARYPGYVISATRSRDQHVIVIVLTRPASMDSRLVRKLAHAQHHAAPPKRRQNNVKNVTGRKIGVDRPWLIDRYYIFIFAGRKISREENFAGRKFREIPFAADIIFAGGKFRGKSKFANIAKISSTRKIGVIQYTVLFSLRLHTL